MGEKEKDSDCLTSPYDKWKNIIHVVYDKYPEEIYLIWSEDYKKWLCKPKRFIDSEHLFKGLKIDGSDKASLIECPVDVLAIEFEKEECHPKDKENIKTNNIIERKSWIEKTYQKALDNNLDAAIVDHGGTSPYVYLFNIGLTEIDQNITDMDVVDKLKLENRNYKLAIAKFLIPDESKIFLDESNIIQYHHIIPIIGRKHWKRNKDDQENVIYKYKQIHKIIKGKNPIDHDNTHILAIPEIIEECQKLTEVVAPNNGSETFDPQNYGFTWEEWMKFITSIPFKDLLKRAGVKNYTQNPCMCPEGHPSEGQACFGYTQNKGTYNCFHSGCMAKGNTIVFYREYIKDEMGLPFGDFRDVIKQASKDYNIDLPKKFFQTKYKDYSIVKRSTSIAGYSFRKLIDGRTQTEKKNEEERYYIEKALASFSIISNQNQKIFDAENLEKNRENIILLGYNDEAEFLKFDYDEEKNIGKNDSYYENEKNFGTLTKILNKAKREKVTIIEQDEEALLYLIKKFKILKTKSTNCFGYIDKKYMGSDKYQLYTKFLEKFGSSMIMKRSLDVNYEKFKEFEKIEYDKKENQKIIEDLNNMPRNDKEGELYKIILSWSIASTLKLELRRLGVDLHPILVVSGGKGKGKTICLSLCVQNFWNSEVLSSQAFEGVKGARLKGIENTIFPRYIDEIKTLDNWNLLLKSSATSGTLKIEKGDSNQNISYYLKFMNISLSTNKFKINDSAFEDRMIQLDYEPGYESTDGELDFGKKKYINKLKNNISKIGKMIYDDFKNIDIKKIIDDKNIEIEEKLKTLVRDKKIKHNDAYRIRDKLLYCGIGEEILNKYNILTKYSLNHSMILNKNSKHISNLKTFVIKAIRNIFHNLTIRHTHFLSDKTKLIKFSDLFNTDDNGEYTYPFNDEVFNQLKDLGIFVSYNKTEIRITKEFLRNIERELKYMGEGENTEHVFKTISDLTDVLEIKYDKSQTVDYVKKEKERGKNRALTICRVDDLLNNTILEEDKE